MFDCCGDEEFKPNANLLLLFRVFVEEQHASLSDQWCNEHMQLDNSCRLHSLLCMQHRCRFVLTVAADCIRMLIPVWLRVVRNQQKKNQQLYVRPEFRISTCRTLITSNFKWDSNQRHARCQHANNFSFTILALQIANEMREQTKT